MLNYHFQTSTIYHDKSLLFFLLQYLKFYKKLNKVLLLINKFVVHLDFKNH